MGRLQEKIWYTSKTVWVNLLGIIFMAAQSQYGWVAPPEVQATILGVINLILRRITKTEIVWS